MVAVTVKVTVPPTGMKVTVSLRVPLPLAVVAAATPG